MPAIQLRTYQEPTQAELDSLDEPAHRQVFQPSLLPAEPAASLTVPEIVAARLAYLRSRVDRDDFSAKHFVTNRTYLTRFAAAFPGRPGDYRQQNFEAWIEGNSKWKSGHTKKSAMNCVLHCFQWAADPDQGGLIVHSPFRPIKAIVAIPYEPRRAASHEEYAAIIRVGSLPLQESLAFVFQTGCRPCEMRELIWPWVHLEASIGPHLELRYHKTIKKTGKPKLIGLDEDAVTLLRKLQARRAPTFKGPLCCCEVKKFTHRPEDHVFFNCDGRPWTPHTFSMNVRRCAARAGLDVGVEKRVSAGCLRTTYACDLIEAGLSNREVANALGHTTTSMVDHVYGAATRDLVGHLNDIANRAAKLRKKP